MAAEIDFQPYLQSISTHYAQWWQLYTLTDAETKAQQKNEPQPWKTPFDFGLMVQTVQGDRSAAMEDPRVEPQAKEKIERFPVLEGIRKYVKEHRQVLLVGRPGSGKSTTLARLLLEEAQNSFALGPPSPPILGGTRVQSLTQGVTQTQSPPELGDLGGLRELATYPESIAQCIPVLVELRFLSDSTILDRIQAFFQRHDLQLDRTQIEDLLFHKRLLLLMDGLNELPSEAARLDVARFRQDYPKVSMIFTTRDLSLGGDFGLEKKLEMQPLTEAQMQSFVRSYVPEQAEAMLQQLKDRLREFGQTPLLLWMLCGLFRQTGEIPANLGEVFRAFTQGYEKHLKADVPVESDRRWWPELLQELAFWMMSGVPFGEKAPAVDIEFRVAISKVETRQIFAAFLQNKEAQAEGVAQKYLDDLLRHHLIQLNGEQVEFRHQLLQEYYAAEYLLGHWEQMSELEFKRDYLNYLKWTESLALLAMFLQKETESLRLVNLASNVDWMLAARLAGTINPVFQNKALKIFNDSEDLDSFKTKFLKSISSHFEILRFPKYIENMNSDFFNSITEVLEENKSDVSLLKLLNLIKDLAYDLHGEAIVGSSQILPLLKFVKYSKADVREKMANSLKKLYKDKPKDFGPILLDCKTSWDRSIQPNPNVYIGISAFQSACQYYNYELTQLTQSMKLFFSYAHKDEPLRDELAKHLSLLKRQNIITDWHDRNITAGTNWAQAIDDNLDTANIILLLISSDFLASDYCYDKEMTRALEHHNQGTARVIPIILRPCDWHSAPFGKLQALPKDAKPVTKWDDPDEAFTHIAQGIRTAVAELQHRKSGPATSQPQTASSQPANVTMNFYGTVHGAAGTVQGDQTIHPTE
jgi:energy-coupling factor transporter ATP-binding protein EcfA2